MDEFSLINRIKQGTYKRSELVKGVGDDAAVFRLLHEDTVVALDTFVEGVHFTKATLSAEQIGYRLLAANLSDVAAMGASPLFYLVSLVIPDDVTDVFVIDIFSGMKELANRYSIDLIGGDTVTGSQLTLSLTIIGSVPKMKVRYRSDAEADDVVFVTGTLGDARAGLALLLGEFSAINDALSRERLIKKHQQPAPRIEFAKKLRRIKRVALNDISDGIANELHEIATESNLSIHIEDASIPISDDLQSFPQELQEEYKYFGGEDFELVGTVARADFPSVQLIGEKLGLNITEIGSVSADKEQNGKVYVHRNGMVSRLKKSGYVHRSRENNDKDNDEK